MLDVLWTKITTPFWKARWRIVDTRREPLPRGLGVGLIYEDCRYEPMTCTLLDGKGDDMAGTSLVTGIGPSYCSPRHCGPVPLTRWQADRILEDFDAYLRRRIAGEEIVEIIGHD